MSIERKLEQWQAAGLIDAATRERIATFERGNERPILLYALGGLGATTIGIGIISIVAANWDAIDKSVKLSVDMLLGMLLAAGIYLSVTRQRAWATEVLIGINYLFVLASLALIGQIYQLGSPIHHALLAWSLSTGPLMLLARTPLLGFLWLSGLVWTTADTTIFYLDRLHARWHYDDALTANVAAVITLALTLAFLCAARTPWIVRERRAISATWTSSTWFSLVCGVFALCFVFYDGIDSSDTLSWSLAVNAVLLGGFATLLPRIHAGLPARGVLGARMLLGFSWLVFALGTCFARADMPGVGASAQVVLLAITAWTVLQLGQLRLFNVLTGLIALRVLCMYFEVFGDMLSTGFGMISGGMLTLLLAWVWKRKSPELAARLAEGGARHAA